VKTKCGTCIYRADCEAPYECDYASITGHTRKAESPENCSYYIKGDRLGREEKAAAKKQGVGYVERPEKSFRGGRRPEYDWEKAKKLYDLGCNDGEIGRLMGIRPQTVCLWRRRKGLESNTTTGGRREEEKNMIVEEVLRELRDVETGYMLMQRPLAGKAADLIEILLGKSQILEEKLKKAGR